MSSGQGEIPFSEQPGDPESVGQAESGALGMPDDPGVIAGPQPRFPVELSPDATADPEQAVEPMAKASSAELDDGSVGVALTSLSAADLAIRHLDFDPEPLIHDEMQVAPVAERVPDRRDESTPAHEVMKDKDDPDMKQTVRKDAPKTSEPAQGSSGGGGDRTRETRADNGDESEREQVKRETVEGVAWRYSKDLESAGGSNDSANAIATRTALSRVAQQYVEDPVQFDDLDRISAMTTQIAEDVVDGSVVGETLNRLNTQYPHDEDVLAMFDSDEGRASVYGRIKRNFSDGLQLMTTNGVVRSQMWDAEHAIPAAQRIAEELGVSVASVFKDEKLYYRSIRETFGDPWAYVRARTSFIKDQMPYSAEALVGLSLMAVPRDRGDTRPMQELLLEARGTSRWQEGYATMLSRMHATEKLITMEKTVRLWGGSEAFAEALPFQEATRPPADDLSPAYQQAIRATFMAAMRDHTGGVFGGKPIGHELPDQCNSYIVTLARWPGDEYEMTVRRVFTLDESGVNINCVTGTTRYRASPEGFVTRSDADQLSFIADLAPSKSAKLDDKPPTGGPDRPPVEGTIRPVGTDEIIEVVRFINESAAAARSL